MRAFMIMDYNNPISVYYSERSIKSFECVSDLVQIETIQCILPDDDLNIVNWDNSRGAKWRSLKERACLLSHARLWRRQAQRTERFIIMEHDAYLWPHMEDSFRLLFEKYKDYPLWSLGIAMEFYSMDREQAEKCRFALYNDNKTLFRGTMHLVHNATDMEKLWPKTGNQIPPIIQDRKGGKYEAPVTQMVSKKQGYTIDDRQHPMIDPLDHPCVFLID